MGGGCEFKEEDCGCVSGEAGCQMPDVKDVCMGRSSCRLDVTQQYIGTGACHGFSDYMYIEFTCLPGMFAEVTCLPGMSAEVTCLQVYLLRSRAHEVCLLSLCEFQVCSEITCVEITSEHCCAHAHKLSQLCRQLAGISRTYCRHLL